MQKKTDRNDKSRSQIWTQTLQWNKSKQQDKNKTEKSETTKSAWFFSMQQKLTNKQQKMNNCVDK